MVPHLYLVRDASLPVGGDRLGEGLAVSLVGRALREHPALNSHYRDGAIETHSRVNVGVVMETPAGAVVPTIFDADRKTPGELEAELGTLRERGTAGALTSPEFAGRTFTLSLETGDADLLLGPVQVGQGGHLTLGRVREAAVAVAGELRAGHAVTLGLSFDGRAVTVPAAGAFMAAVAALIERDR